MADPSKQPRKLVIAFGEVRSVFGDIGVIADEGFEQCVGLFKRLRRQRELKGLQLQFSKVHERTRENISRSGRFRLLVRLRSRAGQLPVERSVPRGKLAKPTVQNAKVVLRSREIAHRFGALVPGHLLLEDLYRLTIGPKRGLGLPRLSEQGTEATEGSGEGSFRISGCLRQGTQQCDGLLKLGASLVRLAHFEQHVSDRVMAPGKVILMRFVLVEFVRKFGSDGQRPLKEIKRLVGFTEFRHEPSQSVEGRGQFGPDRRGVPFSGGELSGIVEGGSKEILSKRL